MVIDRTPYIKDTIESAEARLRKDRIPDWIIHGYELETYPDSLTVSYTIPIRAFHDHATGQIIKVDPQKLLKRYQLVLCDLIAAAKAWLKVYGERTDEEFTIAMEWQRLETEWLGFEEKRHAKSKGGGAVREETKERHDRIEEAGRRLIRNGRPPHAVARIISKTHLLTPRQIRTILQKRGVIKKRK